MCIQLCDMFLFLNWMHFKQNPLDGDLNFEVVFTYVIVMYLEKHPYHCLMAFDTQRNQEILIIGNLLEITQLVECQARMNS